jgi:acetyl esterase/lipase
MAAAPPQSAPKVAATSVRADTFPVLEAIYPGGIVARPHVEFANYVGYRPLQLDLYLHRDRASAPPRPLVLWIHGGGWSRGDARQSGAFTDWPGVLAALAARGYVVASADYRLSGEAQFPAQIQDVKAAIRYLRSKARDYGIDPARVYVWGGSAGGHLAALAATTCGVVQFAPPASTGRLPGSQARTAKPLPQSDCVEGAVIWYGIFDLAKQGPGAGSALTAVRIHELLGCANGSCEAAERMASPIDHVDRSTPPMLLVHGTADTEVSVDQSKAMAAAMREAGAPFELMLVPGANHGLIARDPADTRRDSLTALDRSFAYFDRLARLRR